MDNWDEQAAWQYHHGTKHPFGFLLDPQHRFDPRRRPLLFKQYLNLESLPLPLDPSPTGMPALEAISSLPNPVSGQEAIPDLQTLARLLFFSAGITKRITYPGHGEFFFRAAACTGALYHIELYIVCGDLPGLEAGVYHFNPLDMALDRLRKGDYRQVLVEASGAEPAIQHAPILLVYSDVFWRNAVKYQAREYRHAFWDGGTICSHTYAVAAAHHLPAHLVIGFVDRAVNDLLGLDTRREVSLGIQAIGKGGAAPAGHPPVDPLRLETQPVSDWEKDFPAIRQMHQASSLVDPQQVVSWRAGRSDPAPETEQPAQAGWIPLEPISDPTSTGSLLEKVILRRGSSRRFSRESISFQELSTILQASTRGISADFVSPSCLNLNQVYLFVHAVDGLSPGTYVYHCQAGALEPLKAGEMRAKAGELALGQDLAADASANLYFLADLDQAIERFGNRGYRAAQWEASITAGKMYLAAYALRRGATGLTFFDDEVTNFFSPSAAGKGVMFLIAVGVPARRK